MPKTCDFPTFDADNHFYETTDTFTRHLPGRHKGAIDYVDLHGRTKIMIRGTVSDYIPNPTFEVVARPGAQEEYFRNGNPEGRSYRELIGEPMRSIPAFREPGPRLALMDELGVDRSLMFPTLASLLEERMRDDPELTHAAIHALNEWMYEEWTFNYENRIFATPVITLPIVDRALEELAWVLERAPRRSSYGLRPCPGTGGHVRSVTPSSIPSGRRCRRRTSWCPCTPPTAGTRVTRTNGPARARCCRSASTPSG